ncbi:MAG: flagellar biosynthesis protein FlgD [Pseudomonadales bacterium]|nr:flagellar biosynthesis protein FlgD [Pseudomonadales bacterium]
MSDVSGAGLSSILNDFAIKETPKESNLGRDEFLKLLVTQLENQDPLSPQENGEFVAQLAQFSSLEEAQKLSGSFDSFANSFMSSQHLQATSLVGRPVHVASNVTLLGDDGAVSILADLPAGADDATLSVYDQSGALVDNFELAQTSPGRNEFIWTGENASGVRYPPGVYKFVVSSASDGIVEEAPVFLSSNVNSVTIEPGGSLTLNLAGIGPTSMSEVIQIN